MSKQILNALFQWLQADFDAAVKVVRVSTQGRQGGDWWVKSFILSFSLDGIFFEEYQLNGDVKVRKTGGTILN